MGTRSASRTLLVNDTQRLKLFNYIVSRYNFLLFSSICTKKKHTCLTENLNHGNVRIPKFKHQITLQKTKSYVYRNCELRL